MRELETHFNPTELRDLGNQIASSANTTMSKDKPIVSVSITYRDRPIRAQVITPLLVEYFLYFVYPIFDLVYWL